MMIGKILPLSLHQKYNFVKNLSLSHYKRSLINYNYYWWCERTVMGMKPTMISSEKEVLFTGIDIKLEKAQKKVRLEKCKLSF